MSDRIVCDLASINIPEVIDASLISYKTLFSSLPGAKLHDEAGLLWFESGIPESVFNGVMQTNVARAELPAAIERVRGHFQQRSLPFHWHVGPSSQTRAMRDLLEAHGIRHDEDEPGMAVDLLALNEDVPVAAELAVHEVMDWDMLRQWVNVWGCGAPEEAIEHVFTAYSQVPFGPGQALRFYVGTIDGRPVATAMLFLSEGVATIHYVVTIHELRRRGIGAAMTLLAAREARSAGYRVAVLTASPDGVNIYRRLGFREYCQVSTYVWYPG